MMVLAEEITNNSRNLGCFCTGPCLKKTKKFLEAVSWPGSEEILRLLGREILTGFG
jgi:hypothetical protein